MPTKVPEIKLQRVRNWILAFRPKTLTAAVVPILCGTALLKAMNFKIHWWISLAALFSSLCIQIGTNLMNDAIDFKKGADTAERLGPMRVTQSGHFTAKQVLSMGFFFFVVAALLGIPLVVHGGWPIILVGIISLICGYIYTGGPFPLAYTGLGDLFVVLFFGVIAVCGLFYLQTGFINIESFVLGLQVGFHCTVLIAINNLRDIEGDEKVNKKTLPVRFGKTFARFEIVFLCLVPFLLSFFWFTKGLWIPTVLSFLILPLALKIIKLIFDNEPSPRYNLFLAQAAALHLLFGIMLSIGFIV